MSKISQKVSIGFSSSIQSLAQENSIVFPGVPFSYTITISNFSSQPLNNQSVVTDLIPLFLQITGTSASTGTVTQNGNFIIWTIPILDAFGIATLNIDVVLLSSCQSGPTIINIANLTEYDGKDLSRDNITASVVLSVATFVLSRCSSNHRKNKVRECHHRSKC